MKCVYTVSCLFGFFDSLLNQLFYVLLKDVYILMWNCNFKATTTWAVIRRGVTIHRCTDASRYFLLWYTNRYVSFKYRDTYRIMTQVSWYGLYDLEKVVSLHPYCGLYNEQLLVKLWQFITFKPLAWKRYHRIGGVLVSKDWLGSKTE